MQGNRVREINLANLIALARKADLTMKETGYGTIIEQDGRKLYVDFDAAPGQLPTLHVTDGLGNLLTVQVSLDDNGDVLLSEQVVNDEWDENGNPLVTHTQERRLWNTERVA
jgi:hypothetical protein